MKKTFNSTKNLLLTILTIMIGTSFFTGCRTVKSVSLAYSANEDIDVAYIYFQLYKKNELSGALYVTYNNLETQKAEKFTYWSPVELPAGEPLKLTLRLLYKEPRSDFGDENCIASCCTTTFNAFEATRDVNKEITFNVPPLEPFTDYVISYRKGPGIPGNSYVTLTRKDTKEVILEREFN